MDEIDAFIALGIISECCGTPLIPFARMEQGEKEEEKRGGGALLQQIAENLDARG